jgi:uroporphyrinogen decarboxylase
MKTLSHKERLKLLLEGKEIDRPPISFWRHFYPLETNPFDLARAMIDFQKKFDWDFIKVNPRASYHTEGWGVKVKYSNDVLKKPQVKEYPIKKTLDWEKISYLSPNKGALGEQLEALRIIKREFGEEVFIVMTVFSPLSVAGDLVSSEKKLLNDIMVYPQIIHRVLGIISKTFGDFVLECFKSGAAGIFFATTQWASLDLLTEKEYLEFGKLYDLQVLNRIKDREFNILHVCGGNNMLSLFSDYPVSIVNWDATDPTNLNLKKGAKILNKVILGGTDHNNLLKNGKPDEIKKEIKRTIESHRDIRFILGPGCAISPEVSEANLKAAREAVDEFR